ncbi:MAG: 4'-phosphopantetheinyl transferase superfamily protein [Gammaproteobacteria bacterium]|nr:4'-phosphopantetheinyl transferase superfamily protein [Gammaproteobacteria bacterium]
MYLIPRNEIHIFTIPIKKYTTETDKFIAILDEKEKERALRFRFKADQNRFIVSHAILRLILSHYLQIDTASIQFGENIYGKPQLINFKTNLRFNLSHSKDYALIALAHHPVGVDIEFIDPKMKLEHIVERFFSENEIKEYESLPPEQKRLAFYQAWTRKEAYIKALGQGLVCSLKHFSVTLTPGQPAKIYEICEGCVEDWQLESLALDKNYCAALAWEGGAKNILFKNIENIL